MLQILIIICLFSVYKIATEIYKQYQCPTGTELKKYFYGHIKKNDIRGREITAHLGLCEKCAEKITQI